MGILFGESVDTKSHTFAPLTNDAAILVQWAELVLQTPAGYLWTAPDRTMDLRSYILRGLSADDIAVIPAQIKAVLEADERVAAADVTVSKTFTGGGAVALRMAITITPRGTDALPFTFVGTATAEMVSLMLQGLTDGG